MMFFRSFKIVCLVCAITCFSSGYLAAYGKELQGFPIFEQPDQISCGPTCCSMVLKYYGIDAGIGPLKTKAKTRWLEFNNIRIGMTLPGGIENALESYGLPSSKRYARIIDLVGLIDQNRPPILLVRSAPETWHYLVAVGYKNGGKEVLMADPSGQKNWMASHKLDGCWQFSHDMDGYTIQGPPCWGCNETGLMTNLECPICGGDGRIDLLVGWTKCTCNRGRITLECHMCGGDGRLTDGYRKVVESVGVSGHTLIVPDKGLNISDIPTPLRKPRSMQPVLLYLLND